MSIRDVENEYVVAKYFEIKFTNSKLLISRSTNYLHAIIKLHKQVDTLKKNPNLLL